MHIRRLLKEDEDCPEADVAMDKLRECDRDKGSSSGFKSAKISNVIYASSRWPISLGCRRHL